MTRKSDIKSINCTSCGAGLDVLGGGRVQVQVCGYCGSELDAQDNFAVLRKFADRARPNSPFSIGMTGVIDGVEFTVIGTLGMIEDWGNKVWTWVDHQLFSPTHGYAYLTVEDGHLSFTRRYRGMTHPAWITPLRVETAENRPTMQAADGSYRYFETSMSEISYVEGEFNWRPELGAVSTSVSMLGDAAMLNFRKSASEEEVMRTHYLPAAETYAAFGVTDPPRPTGFDALKPFEAGPHRFFLGVASAVSAVAALMLAAKLVGSAYGGPPVERTLSVNDLPKEIPFTVTEVDRLAAIQVRADVNNSWAFVGVSLSDPEDEPVFEAGRTVEWYSGRDRDGAWSEGSGASTLRFIPRQSGTYTVEIALEEAETWQREGAPLSKVSVVMQQGLMNTTWLQGIALGFALFAIYQISRPFQHRYWQMRQSDWDDA